MNPALDVAVVGSGHAALTVISALNGHNISPTVFSNEQRIGDTWRNRYDALRLNTDANSSAIPNHPPRQSTPKWPSGHQWADYLEDVAHRLSYRHQLVEVERITHRSDGWTVETATDSNHANAVVVATGRNRIPEVPAWPGLGDTTIQVFHSSRFQSAAELRDHDVLVVGSGNSGTEIANLLTSTAASVALSIRTRPHFVRREALGMSITQIGRLAKHVPDSLLDVSARTLQRIQFGDLHALGLAPPELDLVDDVANERGPTVDSGFLRSVRDGQITVVDEIDRFSNDEVILRDGSRLKPDTVIAATGYRTALADLVPSDLLDSDGWPLVTNPPFEAKPGLFFAGFEPASLTSFMPDFAEHLPEIANAISSERRRH